MAVHLEEVWQLKQQLRAFQKESQAQDLVIKKQDLVIEELLQKVRKLQANKTLFLAGLEELDLGGYDTFSECSEAQQDDTEDFIEEDGDLCDEDFARLRTTIRVERQRCAERWRELERW